jgi:hypothetical protein
MAAGCSRGVGRVLHGRAGADLNSVRLVLFCRYGIQGLRAPHYSWQLQACTSQATEGNFLACHAIQRRRLISAVLGPRDGDACRGGSQHPSEGRTVYCMLGRFIVGAALTHCAAGSVVCRGQPNRGCAHCRVEYPLPDSLRAIRGGGGCEPASGEADTHPLMS